MRASRYYMLSFHATHDAIAAEERLKPLLPAAVMPTLRAVSASCGISLRVETAQAPALRAALDGGTLDGLDWMLFFVRDGQPRQLYSPAEISNFEA